MTLTTPYSATFIVGDGETKTFSYLFEEVSPYFISVMVYNSLTGLISTPTYIIDTDQKQVIFGEDTPAPTADETVCIYRNTPNVQDVAFRTLHGYDAQTLENILSKIVAMIQEIKSTYFSTQVLQGDPWQLDLLKSEDNGATVNIDYVAKKLVKGLYFQIKDGNLQVSADGNSYITMPKSVDVAEFRQREVTLPDLTVVYKLEYRVGNIWYDAGGTAESKADEAIQIAEEARDIANEAKEMAIDAKETAEGVEGIAQEAKDIADEALDKVTQEITDREDADSALQDQIDDLSGRGRFLALWNCATGLAESNPPESPYLYKAGDYFVVGTVSSADPVVNYKPDGSSYTTGVASTTVETNEVSVNDTYFYDGTVWKLQSNAQKEVSFSALAGSPYDNTNLSNALNAKANASRLTAHTSNTNNPHEVTKAQVGLGNVDNTSDLNKPISTATQTALNTKADKSEIPTVGNGTITITQGGITKGTFTTNQGSNATIALDAGGGGGAVDSVNGKTGVVVLTATDVGALPDNTVIPDAQIQSDWNQADNTKVDFIKNKPTIPAAQVNSDWNANSGVAQILNKPTIPTVNNPTITITQGGVTKGSFTLNQASGDTIDLDAGGSGGSSYHPDLFDVKWADHICNDVQWLRADTFSWQSGSVYQVAYQHLADDIDGKTLQSETVAGTTIQFYLADDGHKICPASEESNVLAIYNATGVSWYYIIDTTNQRFKLPRTKFGFTGIRSGVGAFVEAGLPDIQGYNGTNMSDSGVPSGAFQSQGRVSGNGGGGGDQNRMNFYAHLYNSIYGNSDTVQPKATEMYLYFYVGNFTQEALENTAGITTEEMNNKADKNDVVGYCSFNTSTRIQITTTDQTAAKNGWLIGHISFSGSNKNVAIYVNSVNVGIYGWSTGSQWFSAAVCLPIKAGQTYRFTCSGKVEDNQMYFYPND